MLAIKVHEALSNQYKLYLISKQNAGRVQDMFHTLEHVALDVWYWQAVWHVISQHTIEIIPIRHDTVEYIHPEHGFIEVYSCHTLKQ